MWIYSHFYVSIGKMLVRMNIKLIIAAYPGVSIYANVLLVIASYGFVAFVPSPLADID